MNRTDRLYALVEELRAAARGYAIDSQHTLPPLNLTAAEVAAVATALAVGSSTSFTQAGRSALQKILAVLTQVDADGAHEPASRIRLFDTRPSQPRPPAVVEHAIVQRRVLEIDYVDKNYERTLRVVEPVAVLGMQPHWYLWAWCRLREAPRGFRLDRLSTGSTAPS